MISRLKIKVVWLLFLSLFGKMSQLGPFELGHTTLTVHWQFGQISATACNNIHDPGSAVANN